MESFGPNAPPPDHHYNHRQQPVADRILRALRHRLLLLHRTGPDFHVLGATGNVYTVRLSTALSCTCPDRTTPCKHILFVLIRVLGVSVDNPCLRRRSLRPCHLNRLLRTPTSPDALAGPALRERFHNLYTQGKTRQGNAQPSHEIEDGTMCPICIEEIGREEKLVACRECKNLIHAECFLKWKRSQGRRGTSCVICRARWRDVAADQAAEYLNLAAYVSAADGGGALAEGGEDAVCGG